MRLCDKRALVTGGANGIGRATATLFAREGAHVVIADVEEAGGTGVAGAIAAAGGRAAFVPADVTDEAAVGRLLEQADATMGGLDVVISNAGTSCTEGLLETDLPAWSADVALNLTGHFLVARAAVPLLARGRGEPGVRLLGQRAVGDRRSGLQRGEGGADLTGEEHRRRSRPRRRPCQRHLPRHDRHRVRRRVLGPEGRGQGATVEVVPRGPARHPG